MANQPTAAAKGNGAAPRFDLSRKPTREITISHHFTDRVVGFAVRVDQVTNEMDRALSRRTMDFKQSMEIQSRINGLLDSVEEELRQISRQVRKTPTRSRNGRNNKKAAPATEAAASKSGDSASAAPAKAPAKKKAAASATAKAKDEVSTEAKKDPSDPIEALTAQSVDA